ncbi:endoribonuclease L-PSP, putative [Caldisphaera lagunensis DSM 15908]|uniref:Endoribonuclease L-PSP, putative n=1 Tax=Caldisphaera lagunensis (strain DSM 15908 / JCM 11604 / ANMR 0165 / IC-154) TaxID=1056495 RepID=L0AB92_CALLD|nr:Rid family detoxifying hydrolase [Caldisphaera lagunensis]AFZ70320.1 endoribonuclease L-PSP, putative [Caldisphaera lagunensis DSM 15908]
MREAVFTDKAPKPIGPYSQAISYNGLLFISGQVPLDPKTGKIVSDNFEEQVRRVLENIKAILEASNLTFENLIKVTVFMKDSSKFSIFNNIYSTYFKGQYPSRSVIFVNDLPANAQIEVEAIAAKD